MKLFCVYILNELRQLNKLVILSLPLLILKTSNNFIIGTLITSIKVLFIKVLLLLPFYR